MFALFDLYIELTKTRIVYRLNEPYSKDDVIQILNDAVKWINSQTNSPFDYSHVLTQAATNLGLRNDTDIQYVIDYAMDKKIPLILTDTLRSLTPASIDRYLAYLNLGTNSPIESIAEARKYLPNVFVETQWSRDEEFVQLVRIFVKASHLMTEASRNEVDLNIVRVARLVNYEDFIALIKLKSGSCLQLSDKTKITWAIGGSIQNPDPRAFDYFFDKYLVTLEVDLRKLVVSCPNIRSLRKLMLFAYGMDRYPTFERLDRVVFSQLALLGTFKLESLRREFDTTAIGRQCDMLFLNAQAEIVISCLKTNLPNVLVDLVLQYLV